MGYADVLAALGAANIPAVSPCNYNFPVTSVPEFLALAQIIEGSVHSAFPLSSSKLICRVGVSAYLGAAASIQNKAILTAAGSILPVEARHNTFLIGTNEGNPIPAAFDTPLGFNEVFSLASTFIVSCPATNPTLPFKAFPPLEVGDPIVGSGETVCVENVGDGTFAVVIAGLQTFPVKVEGGEFVFPQDPSIQGQVLTLFTC